EGLGMPRFLLGFADKRLVHSTLRRTPDRHNGLTNTVLPRLDMTVRKSVMIRFFFGKGSVIARY
ncbi:MAG: hypothetical protein OSB38_27095, partial [Paraburkholderia fungorum]|nr:hypothetical protein [Paraburkholderia fungorum]